jgi:3-methyladenine DNA glycosylase AlkD
MGTQNAAAVRAALEIVASPARAARSLSFFKAGKGEYGEGDRFIGVTVPEQRKVARIFQALPLPEVLRLLRSPIHEHRLTALLILVRQYQRGQDETRAQIAKAYLANTQFVNNWDLVDSSAPYILGNWLLNKDRSLLFKLAKSKVLWQRRIAIIATQEFIRNGQSEDAFAIATLLLKDEHDLMHKAVGWMLREIGKRIDVALLRVYLHRHAARMARTALRYAIEHLPPAERKRWLAAA